LLQGVMMMLANPSFALADGGKLERIKGHEGIVKYDADNRSGDIKLVVDNRVLITVEGNGVGRDELLAYAQAIDFDKLAE
ncbi:MAG: hypothetical protein ACKOZX_04510, partial [Gammaproteobacteria bacterium]